MDDFDWESLIDRLYSVHGIMLSLQFAMDFIMYLSYRAATRFTQAKILTEY